MAADDFLFKQWFSVIDARTTVVCLHAAGQIRPLTAMFDTLAGQYDHPPAHVHCRAIDVPYMAGFVNEIRRQANAELQRRPIKQRRIGPDGEIGGYIPPPPAPAIGTGPKVPKVVTVPDDDADD